MAVGDGGFSTKPMGFDKNEVNEYISNLRKKMNELEAEKKANEKKTAEAVKLAESADDRVKAAEKAGEEKVAAVSQQLSDEKRFSEKIKRQLDETKKQLAEEKQKMSDMLRTGRGVDTEAKRAYNEVIAKANSDAAEITDKAKSDAEAIIAEAEARRREADEKLSRFMELLRGQLETINGGYKAINDCASDILGAAVTEVPAFVEAVSAYKPVQSFDDRSVQPEETSEKKPEQSSEASDNMPAPAANEEPEPAGSEQPEPVSAPAAANEPAPAAETEPEPVKEPEPAEQPEPAAVAAPEPEQEPENAEDDTSPDVFGEWGGSELAESIFAEEKDAQKKEEVPLVNPDAMSDIFGGLFTQESEAQGSDDDMSSSFSMDMNAADTVDSIKPLDTETQAKASPDNAFESELISQTMTSSNLEGVDEDLLRTVREAEAKFAVQPSDTVKDLDMDALDMDENSDEEKPSAEDELMKALREAEEALSSLGGGGMDISEPAEEEEAPAKVDISSANPWEDLQKQLEQMEQAGNFGDDGSSFGQTEQPQAPAEPAAPSADDSSIWNFGGGESSSGSDDDDMSGDMFGGFGGF